jgi:CheY-like chemotaxis protein
MQFRALILCDVLDSLEVLCAAMNKVGMTREICTEPEAARYLLDTGRFDAVFVDCDDMELGTTFLHSIRRNASNKHSVSFAILNGTEAAQAFALGATFVLQKPLLEQKIIRSLETAQGFMMREQRRAFRQPLRTPVQITGLSGKNSFDVRNVSANGLGISDARKLLRPEEIVSVWMRVPTVDTPLDARAEVVWTSDDGNAGLRFLQIEPLPRKKLDGWLNQCFEQNVQSIAATAQVARAGTSDTILIGKSAAQQC